MTTTAVVDELAARIHADVLARLPPDGSGELAGAAPAVVADERDGTFGLTETRTGDFVPWVSIEG